MSRQTYWQRLEAEQREADDAHREAKRLKTQAINRRKWEKRNEAARTSLWVSTIEGTRHLLAGVKLKGVK